MSIYRDYAINHLGIRSEAYIAHLEKLGARRVGNLLETAERRHTLIRQNENLPELKKKMMHAHPDLGGDEDKFIALHKRYTAARKRQKENSLAV